MVLNLKEFEQQIDPVILKRGLKYFKAGTVTEIERSADGTRNNFIVEGTELYDVNVKLRDDEVVDYSCNCPYDMGPVCKHVVAALFYLEQNSFAEYTEIEASPAGKKQKSVKAKAKKYVTATDIQKIVSSMTVDELRNFIIGECADKSVKMRLVNAYGERILPPSVELFRTQIRTAINEAKGRYGYVEYDNTCYVYDVVTEIIENACENMSVGKWDAAWVKLQAVIEEVDTILNSGDDSSGYLGCAVSAAFDAFDGLDSDSIPDNVRRNMFDKMISWCENGYLSGWGWDLNFVRIAIGLSSGASSELDRIERLLTPSGDEDDMWNSGQRLAVMASFIGKRYSQDEADKFVYQNRYNPEFRQQLIEQAIVKGDSVEALKLADEGIVHDKDDDELVAKWKEYQFQVYQQTGDNAKIVEIAEYFFLHGVRFPKNELDYYAMIKNAVPSEEWSGYVSHLIEKITREQRHGSDYFKLRFIYIEEGMWEEYMQLLKHNASLANMEEAEKHLAGRYHDDFIRLYETAICEYAEHNLGRSAYAEVTRYLRRLKKLGEGALVNKLVDDFKAKYPRRRAMMDELNML